MNISLDKFGRFLMENLRDRAINNYEGLASFKWKAPALAALQHDLSTLTPEQRMIVRRCVFESIDAGIHDFLFKLQEPGRLRRVGKLLPTTFLHVSIKGLAEAPTPPAAVSHATTAH